MKFGYGGYPWVRAAIRGKALDSPLLDSQLQKRLNRVLLLWMAGGLSNSKLGFEARPDNRWSASGESNDRAWVLHERSHGHDGVTELET